MYNGREEYVIEYDDLSDNIRGCFAILDKENNIFVKTINKQNKKELYMKLGLALCGGGIRGIAHAGILKAFEENNIVQEDLIATDKNITENIITQNTVEEKVEEENKILLQLLVL